MSATPVGRPDLFSRPDELLRLHGWNSNVIKMYAVTMQRANRYFLLHYCTVMISLLAGKIPETSMKVLRETPKPFREDESALWGDVFIHRFDTVMSRIHHASRGPHLFARASIKICDGGVIKVSVALRHLAKLVGRGKTHEAIEFAAQHGRLENASVIAEIEVIGRALNAHVFELDRLVDEMDKSVR